MATGRYFERYFAVAVFILVYEYGNTRPTMDSLYGDHVYSGDIYPISGAVPKKIHSHERRKTTPAVESPTGKIPPSMNSSPGMIPASMNSSPEKTPPSINFSPVKTTPSMNSSPGNGPPSMNSTSGNGPPSMNSTPGNGPPSMNSTPGNGPPPMNSTPGKTPPSMNSSPGNTSPAMNSSAGKMRSVMMDSLYGDHVYSGSIHPISGAVPKKIYSSSYSPTAAKTRPAMNSQSGKTRPALDSQPGKGSPEMNSNPTTAGPAMDSDSGKAGSEMNSLYGDSVFSGAIYPISGAVPKKIHSDRGNEAAPVRDYDGVPSGILRPISGVVPISVPRRRPGAINEVLRAIRSKVDKSLVAELDSSIHNDISQDELAPPECADHYGIRDGVLKHNIRGIRDVVEAVVKDFQGIGQGPVKNLPLVPNVINGVAEAITHIICGAEEGASDIISGFDDFADILTKVIVDLIEIKGFAPLANVPAGIVNATKLIRKVGAKAGHDIVLGIEEGAGDLATEVESGINDVAKDVGAIVSGAETGVMNVANAVRSGVQRIRGGVGDDVGSIVKGIKGGIRDVVGLL